MLGWESLRFVFLPITAHIGIQTNLSRISPHAVYLKGSKNVQHIVQPLLTKFFLWLPETIRLAHVRLLYLSNRLQFNGLIWYHKIFPSSAPKIFHQVKHIWCTRSQFLLILSGHLSKWSCSSLCVPCSLMITITRSGINVTLYEFHSCPWSVINYYQLGIFSVWVAFRLFRITE